MASTDELHSLIARSGWGDQQAFAALYQATAPTLLSLARRILGSSALAEEALQEAFVKAWHGSSDYNPNLGEPLAWLAGIVRHRAIDLVRREGRQQNRDQAAAAEAEVLAPTATEGASSVELQALLACLEALPPQQRTTLLMTYYQGYSNAELASRLAAPLGTVKSWVRRATASVRVCLESSTTRPKGRGL